MAGEVSWDDEEEVQQVILDVRDAECGLNWVIFGYGEGGPAAQKIGVIECGEGGIDEMREHLRDDQVMYAFMQIEEKACAFFLWKPSGASMMYKAKAAVHRSFVTKFLGALAVDVYADSLDDVSQAKIDEEMDYHNSTQGKALDSSEAVKKLEEAAQRKKEMLERQKIQGNTHAAQQNLAKHSVSNLSQNAKLHQASGTNSARSVPSKSQAHSIYSKTKVDIEIEEEDELKELLLDLREAEVGGDFDWLIIGYAEGKKNTLQLIETGNGGREALADFLTEDMGGALDRIMYILIKEDDSSANKLSFVNWIGKNVSGFVKANSSTHRGAISGWLSQVVHNLKEETVQSPNDLLGLKDEEEDQSVLDVTASQDPSMSVNQSGVFELESKLYSKPYAGKVMEDVKREKTPQELWQERKLAKSSGENRNSSGSAKDLLKSAEKVDPGALKQTLRSKTDRTSSVAGKSKYALKKQGSTSDKAEAAAAARAEAEKAEQEAAEKRKKAKLLEDDAAQALEAVVGEVPDWSPDESPSGSPRRDTNGDPAPAEAEDAEDEEEKQRSQEQEEIMKAIEDARKREQEMKEQKEAKEKARKEEEEQAKKEAEDEAASKAAEAAEQARIADEKAKKEQEAKEEEEKQQEMEREAKEEEERTRKEEEQAKAAAEAEAKAAEEAKAKVAAEEAEAKAAAEAQAKEEEAQRLRKEKEASDAEAKAKEQEEVERQKAQEEAEAAEKSRKEAEEAAEKQKQAELEDARKKEEAKLEEERLAREAKEAEEQAQALKEEQERQEREKAQKEEQERKEKEEQERVEKEREEQAKAEREKLEREQKEQEEARKENELKQEAAQQDNGRNSIPNSLTSQGSQKSMDLAAKKAALLAEADASKRAEEDEIRRRAEELLARKKALLEEAARRHKGISGDKSNDTASRPSSLGDSASRNLPGDAERLRRAEEYRQKKMAELANKKGGEDAAAKKAAFLKEAEEAVRRAAQQEAQRRKEQEQKKAAVAHDDSDGSAPATPPSPAN